MKFPGFNVDAHVTHLPREPHGVELAAELCVVEMVRSQFLEYRDPTPRWLRLW